MNDATFETALTGKTLSAVENPSGDELVFVGDDGTRYHLFHDQDCCESVTIESISGDLADLVGSPILFAYEAQGERPADVPEPEYDIDSETWTFYRIGTAKGSVVIRWYGTSNGYYSESVDFEVLPATEQSPA